jgi:hypothetical protein
MENNEEVEEEEENKPAIPKIASDVHTRGRSAAMGKKPSGLDSATEVHRIMHTRIRWRTHSLAFAPLLLHFLQTPRLFRENEEPEMRTRRKKKVKQRSVRRSCGEIGGREI